MTESKPAELLVAGLSRTGRRSGNEDAADWKSFGPGSAVRGYALVCDGMGGHNAGEVASAMALEAMRSRLAELAATPEAGPGIGARVEGWVSGVNQEIRREGEAKPQQRGMGTTLALAFVTGSGELVVANVGDSKVFRVRGVTVAQLSTDHTALAEQRRILGADSATPEDAVGNPFAHALTRSLGQEENTLPDVRAGEELRPGDLVIVTSDGVTDVLESERFLGIIENCQTLEEVAESIYQLSFDAGSKDNISVALLSNGRPTRLGLGVGRNPEGEEALDATRPLMKRPLPAGPTPRPGPGSLPAASPAPPTEPTPLPARRQPPSPSGSRASAALGAGAAAVLLFGIVGLFLIRRQPGAEPGAAPARVRPTAPGTTAPVRAAPTASPAPFAMEPPPTALVAATVAPVSAPARAPARAAEPTRVVFAVPSLKTPETRPVAPAEARPAADPTAPPAPTSPPTAVPAPTSVPAAAPPSSPEELLLPREATMTRATILLNGIWYDIRFHFDARIRSSPDIAWKEFRPNSMRVLTRDGAHLGLYPSVPYSPYCTLEGKAVLCRLKQEVTNFSAEKKNLLTAGDVVRIDWSKSPVNPFAVTTVDAVVVER